MVAFLVAGPSSVAMSQPAYPGAQGFGVETTHGRNGIVVRVTNTNDSGPGSLRQALSLEEPRIIVFTVSGTINLSSSLKLNAANSHVYVAGQTAPGDGIALAGPVSGGPQLHLSETSAFSDGVFRFIRFRHGGQGDWTVGHNIFVESGTNRVVFDHISSTWSSKQAFTLWGSDIRDITISHSILGEGVKNQAGTIEDNPRQNGGPFFSNGTKYNISFHHNLLVHTWYRAVKIDSGNGGGSSRGVQFINNVHYNTGTADYGFHQNQYTGTTPITVDVIGDYFLRGPDSYNANKPAPFTYGTESLSNNWSPMSLHLAGSTWRNQDGTAHRSNNESNNYAMMQEQNYGPPYRSATYTRRGSPLSTQPRYPVIQTPAQQAYTDIVFFEDVGVTKPRYDAVDKRLVDDPEDGGRWMTSSIPAPFGTAVYPALSTYDVPTDTDNDGVPNAFENILGTNPNVYELQAALDHDGDGFSNVEEWIHSISESVAESGNKPKPPTFATN